ncbi:hypothetical protein ACUHGC_07670 [Testudinibacter sp. P27/CKL/0425]
MASKWTEIPELKEMVNEVKARYPLLWERLSAINIQITEAEAKEFDDLKMALMSLYHLDEKQLIELGEEEFKKYKRSINARFDAVLLFRSIFK